ncbi:MAG: nitrilase-related carbon-nitrogen hydrolase [Candidatus Calescibacterium sp.]|nr:acyltransferase [Candidatus Calescibacterium sp.]MDW8133056.1 nitrilase-related carbon-nitrogen hydrolase [Candidatus Calescibacterium sp.]
MKLGVLQFNPVHKNVNANYKVIEEYLKGVEDCIIVLPELCTTGYLFERKEELYDLAEEIPNGNLTYILMSLAKKNNLLIVAGVAEKDDKKLYNSAVVISPDGFIGKYRKINLFYKENLIFERGERLDVFQVNFLNQNIMLGIMICFDWFFPEIARKLKLMGANIIAHPSNLVLPYCPKAMPIRALENKLYTITANRIGIEHSENDTLKFIGQSVICSPKAEYLMILSEEDYGVFSVETDLKIEHEITKFNNFQEDIEKLYKQLPFLGF